MIILLGGVLEEPGGGADGWMASEGNFAVCGEDVNSAFLVAGFGFVDEDGFGEVEFSGDVLFLGLG